MNYKTIDKNHYWVKKNYNFGNKFNLIIKNLLQLLDSSINYLLNNSPYIYNDSRSDNKYKTNVDLDLIRTQRTFL